MVGRVSSKIQKLCNSHLLCQILVHILSSNMFRKASWEPEQTLFFSHGITDFKGNFHTKLLWLAASFQYSKISVIWWQPNTFFWNFSLMSICSLLIVQYTYFRFSWKLSCHWIINTLKFLLWEANQVVLRGPNVCKSWDCQDHFSYFSKNQWS